MTVHKPLSSFALPGKGVRTIRFRTIATAVSVAKNAHLHGLPVIPLGAGTNCVFLEPKLSAVFLQSRDTSLTAKRAGSKMLVTAGAGLPWDDLVKFAVHHDLRGLECLSGIPGTCGAAPVQNIGAYGANFAATLQSVDVLNLKTLQRQKLQREECGFGYRSSIFNTTERGTFLICSITLALESGRTAKPPRYSGFEKFSSARLPLSTIRRTILRIRREKRPDHTTTPNCGSFFKNPVVSRAAAMRILKKYPTIPHWRETDGKTKFSAAWLIDHINLRNRHWGKIRISPQHALILINDGETAHNNLRRAIKEIVATVYKTFGIVLETEPNLFNKAFVQKFAEKQIGHRKRID
jgi:UDP-N-acetylmuramate dehydrogenase